MNREIKFRAFNEKGIEEGRWLYFDLESNPYQNHFTCIDWAALPKCQFTGLLDKNGKEIYEGDILKALGLSDFISVVVWDDAQARFMNKAICGGSFVGAYTPKLTEIIGNIYENPELLEGQSNGA